MRETRNVPKTDKLFYLHDGPEADGADGVTDSITNEDVADIGDPPATGNVALKIN